jgi:hypothetical protein
VQSRRARPRTVPSHRGCRRWLCRRGEPGCKPSTSCALRRAPSGRILTVEVVQNPLEQLMRDGRARGHGGGGGGDGSRTSGVYPDPVMRLEIGQVAAVLTRALCSTHRQGNEWRSLPTTRNERGSFCVSGAWSRKGNWPVRMQIRRRLCMKSKHVQQGIQHVTLPKAGQLYVFECEAIIMSRPREARAIKRTCSVP